jgi:site-specific recombinase XerD
MGEVEALGADGVDAATGSDALPRYTAAWLLGYKSAHTRNAYARDLSGYLGFLAAHEVDVFAARRAHVDAYARRLEEAGATPATVARKLSATASFYKYLLAEEVIGKSPCTHVRRPAVDGDSQSTGLDKDEVRRLLAAAREDSPRACAFVSLLAGNGLRVSEALALDVADVGAERGHRTVQITRKGGKKATVPLAPPVADALDAYLDGRVAGPLFATATGARVDRVYARRLVKRLAKDAGITGAVSPHTLRHAFVTLSLDAGVPLRDVQDAAGHADPRTTRRYDRARHNLDRHAAYALSAYLAE